ncbi:MAG: DNA polymerase III subunit alpha [Caulobacterales bacterium]
MPQFVHLRARSAYSVLDGALHVKALAKLAAKMEMPALALCDENNLFGALEFSEALAEAGVQPIAGCALDIKGEGGIAGAIAVLAQSETGYANLMRLSTSAFLDVPANAEPHVTLDALAKHKAGLILLTGGTASPIAALLDQERADDAEALLLSLAEMFSGRLYVELMRHGERIEAETEVALVELAYKHNLPLVATNDVRFKGRADHKAHDALMCISASSYLGAQDRPRITDEHYFKSADEMAALFADLPEAIANTVEIAQRCHFRPHKRKPILPRFTTGAGRDEAAELRAQAELGLAARLEQVTPSATLETYKERLDYELGIITQMGFPGYFLIVSDFIKWAKARDIPVGPGRGSGAGSLVAWALTITDLDPLRFSLFFERFLNPERVSMPDFDIDFCQDRRGEVIEYVREKYGEDRVAQIITFGTLQARAVLRDVGRVMQLPFGQVDRLAKLVPANPANPVTLQQAIELEPKLKQQGEQEPEVGELLDIAQQLEGLHRNASTHAAGIVIGDRPLVELVGLYRDPRSDIPATQFNMKWVEAAGLVKFDFLGLKTLTVIDRAVKLIRDKNIEIDLQRMPLDDMRTYEMLQRGETVGVFQVESQGMRRALVDMKPDRFEDLIALVALYRPGPMANIPTYCNRKKGIEPIDDETYFGKALRPWLEPILEPTLGIITYQEQVMQIARDMAGYSFGEADLLRRAMGKKIRAEMEKQRARFLSGCLERGITEADAERTFDACAKFADYGFNKSHSAPYALLTYQTAWLKANHPVEFFAASMSLDATNTDKLAVFRQDARRMGVDVLPPDVNESGADFTVENGAVRYALGAVRNVGMAAMESVVAARGRGGKFKDLFDFAERLDAKTVNRRQLENLAKAGAFDVVEPERARVFAACETLAAYAQRVAEDRASNQASLFGASEPSVRPALPKAVVWSAQDRLDNERESVGFYLSGHPLSDFFAEKPAGKIMSFSDILDEGEVEPRVYQMAGVVRSVKYRPAQSGGQLGFAALSDPSGEYEVMIMPEHIALARDRLVAGKAVALRAKARWRDGELRLAGDGFEPIEAAEARAASDLKIILREGAPLDALAETLKALAPTAGADTRPLRLVLRLKDGREVEVRPPGLYPAGPSARAAMKAARGVERVI